MSKKKSFNTIHAQKKEENKEVQNEAFAMRFYKNMQTTKENTLSVRRSHEAQTSELSKDLF